MILIYIGSCLSSIDKSLLNDAKESRGFRMTRSATEYFISESQMFAYRS